MLRRHFLRSLAAVLPASWLGRKAPAATPERMREVIAFLDGPPHFFRRHIENTADVERRWPKGIGSPEYNHFPPLLTQFNPVSGKDEDSGGSQ